jgi:hypothetical protein
VELLITFQAGSQNINTFFTKNKRCTSHQVPNRTDTVILATVANLILMNKDKNITKSGNWQPG